jgi:hypothetical protein
MAKNGGFTTGENARARFSKWIRDVKKVPCMDCGKTLPPECMDFDHRPGTDKKFGVAEMGGRRMSVVLEEIAKCDIVCANCHRIRTFARRRDGYETQDEDA